MVVERRLAVVFVLLVTACNANGDRARLSVSLGSSAGALALEGVDITRFVLTVTCLDGSETTERGDVGADGAFEADVPRCPRATVRFRGLTTGDNPALDGRVDIAISAPATEVTIPVRRVGTVSFVNDDSAATVCSVRVPSAPEFEAIFALAPGAETSHVLPVNGVSLSCAAADTCGGIEACNFDGPLAITRAVAVPFGSSTTLSLTNLSNTLVFNIGPPSPVSAGLAFGPFEVTLVDERSQAIARSDVDVVLVPETATTLGGFSGAQVTLANGVARFTNVRFTTAGSLTFHAQAVVNGVLLVTESRTVSVLPGLVGQLVVSGPPSVTAGVAANFTITAADSFGNATSLPSDIGLSSNDPQTSPARFLDVGAGVLPFTLFTAGTHTITARMVQQPSVLGTAQVDVGAAAATRLDLTSGGPTSFVISQVAAFTVRARDDWNNIDAGYRGDVSLLASPATGFAYQGSHVFTAGDAGSFVFTSVVFGALGEVVLSATDVGGLTSAGLVLNIVNAGVIDHFDVQVSPPMIVAGSSVTVNVTARDAGNAVVGSYNNLVFMTSTGGCSQTVNIMNGSGSASCTMTVAGDHTVLIDYMGTSGESSLVNVAPTTGHYAVLLNSVPNPLVTGELFDIVVQITDAYGNVVAPGPFAAAVSLSIAPAGLTIANVGIPGAVGNTLVFSNLAINSPGTAAVINVDGMPGGSTPTNPFDIVEGSGCPVAYVSTTGNGANDGCTPSSPVPDVALGVSKVDTGGHVRIEGGTYGNPVHISSRRVTLEGGWSPGFGTRDPFAYPTVIAPLPAAPIAVEATSAADVTLDGLVIRAPDPQTASDVRFAVRANAGSNLKVQSCRLIGPVTDLGITGGVAQIGDAIDVLFVNNWMHVGGAPSGTVLGSRSGIVNTTAAPRIDIVHNTIVLAAAPRSEALYLGATAAQATFTKNVVVGNFSSCASNGGVCAVVEASTTALRSSLYNYVLGTNSVAANYTYIGVGSQQYSSLDGPVTDSFEGNVTLFNQSFGTAVVDADGGDDNLLTMADNDWHLAADVGRTSFDATQALCGLSDPTPNEPCRGTALDIDGGGRSATSSPGADEFGSGAPGA